MRNAANLSKVIATLLLAVLGTRAMAAGNLAIEQGWIRAAAPGAKMLAGYARLHNTGGAAIIVTGAESTDFKDVSLHESVEENGVEHMRPLGNVSLAPGASVDLAPGGKHLMLMGPKRELTEGETVKIRISVADGDAATAEFVVRDEAP